jgi:hypothetical protein
MTDITNNKKEYLETKVKPTLDELVFQLLCEHLQRIQLHT